MIYYQENALYVDSTKNLHSKDVMIQMKIIHVQVVKCG